MKHLNYELLDDFLDFDGRFEGLHVISEDYYRHLAADLMARLDLDYMAGALNFVDQSINDEAGKQDDESITAAELRESLESAFDTLWDEISDKPQGINKVLYSGSWVIIYDCKSVFSMTVLYSLSMAQFYSNGSFSMFI